MRDYRSIVKHFNNYNYIQWVDDCHQDMLEKCADPEVVKIVPVIMRATDTVLGISSRDAGYEPAKYSNALKNMNATIIKWCINYI